MTMIATMNPMQMNAASTPMRVATPTTAEAVAGCMKVEKCPRVTNIKKISGKINSHAPSTVSTQDSTNCVKTRSRAAEKPEEKTKNFYKTP